MAGMTQRNPIILSSDLQLYGHEAFESSYKGGMQVFQSPFLPQNMASQLSRPHLSIKPEVHFLTGSRLGKLKTLAV